MSDQKPKKQGTIPNKGSLQAYIQNFSKEAIDCIVYVMRNTRNENLRMGAAKVIIDKSIPDVKAIELTGKDGEPFKLYIDAGHGFIPSDIRSLSTSTTGPSTGQSSLQSSDLAQKSPQDNNSDNGVNKTEST